MQTHVKQIQKPEGHHETDDKDISMCPFMKNKSKQEQEKIINEQNQDKEELEESEDEVIGGGGGCPFMMSSKF